MQELSNTAIERVNNGLYDDAIRKCWVASVDQEFKNDLLKLPQPVRFETYNAIDKLIFCKLTELIVSRKNELVASGAETVYNKETDTHQFKENINIQELITQATALVIEEF